MKATSQNCHSDGYSALRRRQDSRPSAAQPHVDPRLGTGSPATTHTSPNDSINCTWQEVSRCPIKKLSYVLRPLRALCWLRQHGGQQFPSMHFRALMEETDLSAALQQAPAILIAQKAATPELGHGPSLPGIATFIDAELAAARAMTAPRPTPPPRAHVAAAEAFCLLAIRGD
jgi:predicted nucleotidyltransferase